MNDRFKFRAYGFNKMEYDIQNDADFYFYFDINSDYIPMQCTGLKDKNGILIYEGDIVKFGEEIYEAAYRTEWACFVIQPPTSSIEVQNINSVETQTCFMEVIGNIYENPELLKGAKK